MIKHSTILILTILFEVASIHVTIADHTWIDMQQQYHALSHELYKQTYPIDKNFCHPIWITYRNEIKNIIFSSAGANFIKHGSISGSMIRGPQHTVVQDYELAYLTYCLKAETKKLIFSYQDQTFLPIPRDCLELHCSNNTLGHLYYAANLLEHSLTKPEVIVELGGGYGNLARILKSIIQDSTIILIDLPELLALQYYFLKMTLPETLVILHNKQPAVLERNAIHLVPVFFVENLSIKADAFVSTFALSEASVYTQSLIEKKEYFNASICYIVGQLDGWGKGFNFEKQDTVFNSIRKKYTRIICHPFHSLLNNVKSYEIMGIN